MRESRSEQLTETSSQLKKKTKQPTYNMGFLRIRILKCSENPFWSGLVKDIRFACYSVQKLMICNPIQNSCMKMPFKQDLYSFKHICII